MFNSSYKNLIVLALLTAVLSFAACGKKADPKAPELSAPASVKFFMMTADVNGVTLNWQAPEEDASGGRLSDLAGFVIERSEYEKDSRPDFDEIGVVKVDPAKAASALDPQSFAFRDEKLVPGKKYDYIVMPKNEDGVKGVPSSTLRVTFRGLSSVVETL